MIRRSDKPPNKAPVPLHVGGLAALYAVASLAHFTHNAEYIALYPNMPPWLTRENVYAVWLAVSCVGVSSAVLWLCGWRGAAAVALALYGLLGLDALGHYTLALCSEHTLAMNVTIGFEALTGLLLASASLWDLGRRHSQSRRSFQH